MKSKKIYLNNKFSSIFYEYKNGLPIILLQFLSKFFSKKCLNVKFEF